VFCGATAIASPAQVLATLHSFNGSDGSNPYTGVVQGTDGSFFRNNERRRRSRAGEAAGLLLRNRQAMHGMNSVLGKTPGTTAELPDQTG
jgi:hypothetical protein